MLIRRAGSRREGYMAGSRGTIKGRKADEGRSQGGHKTPGEREGRKRAGGPLPSRASTEGLSGRASTPAGW